MIFEDCKIKVLKESSVYAVRKIRYMYCIDLSYVFMAYVNVVLVLGRKDLRERRKYKLLFLQSFLNYIFEY